MFLLLKFLLLKYKQTQKLKFHSTFNSKFKTLIALKSFGFETFALLNNCSKDVANRKLISLKRNPFIARSLCIQYMPSKHAKYGLKLWVSFDVQYVLIYAERIPTTDYTSHSL